MAAPEGRTTLILAVIGAVAGLIGTIVSLFTLIFTVTQAQVSTAQITDPPELRNPTNCTYQTTVDGFRLSGKTKLQTGDVLWVLLKTGQSSFYVMSSEPVATSSGHWSIDLSDVGSMDDRQGAMYTFWIVSANPNGSQSILVAYQGPSEGELRQLPAGVSAMTTGCAHK